MEKFECEFNSLESYTLFMLEKHLKTDYIKVMNTPIINIYEWLLPEFRMFIKYGYKSRRPKHLYDEFISYLKKERKYLIIK